MAQSGGPLLRAVVAAAMSPRSGTPLGCRTIRRGKFSKECPNSRLRPSRWVEAGSGSKPRGPSGKATNRGFILERFVFLAPVPPHPGPLPRGEGELQTVGGRIERYELAKNAVEGVPSPLGPG